MQVRSPGAPCTPSHFGMSLGRGIQGTNLPPSLSPSVAVPPSAAVWSMPLCRVLWFVLNKLLSQKNLWALWLFVLNKLPVLSQKKQKKKSQVLKISYSIA